SRLPWSESGRSRHTPPPRPPRRARCTDRPNPHQSLDSPLDSPLGPTSGLWASSPFSFLKHPCRVTSNFGGWTFSFNLSLRERGTASVPPGGATLAPSRLVAVRRVGTGSRRGGHDHGRSRGHSPPHPPPLTGSSPA